MLCLCMCVHACVCICMRVNCVHACVCEYVYVYVCVCMHACVCICMCCVCMCGGKHVEIIGQVVSISTIEGLGTELRLSGLASSTFTHLTCPTHSILG